MSAWQLVNAWSGFHADLVDRTPAFRRLPDGDIRLPWSAGSAWGLLVRSGLALELRMLGGSLPAMTVDLTARLTICARAAVETS